MAYTFTAAANTVFGNQRVQQGVLTCDATSGIVSFGFSSILHLQATAQSATTAAPRFRINKSAAGVASAGDLGVSGAVNGDEFLITVFGK